MTTVSRIQFTEGSQTYEITDGHVSVDRSGWLPVRTRYNNFGTPHLIEMYPPHRIHAVTISEK